MQSGCHPHQNQILPNRRNRVNIGPHSLPSAFSLVRLRGRKKPLFFLGRESSVPTHPSGLSGLPFGFSLGSPCFAKVDVVLILNTGSLSNLHLTLPSLQIIACVFHVIDKLSEPRIYPRFFFGRYVNFPRLARRWFVIIASVGLFDAKLPQFRDRRHEFALSDDPVFGIDKLPKDHIGVIFEGLRGELGECLIVYSVWGPVG